MPGRTRGHPSERDRELRFLILEDAVADAKLCERELQRAGLRFTLRQVETLAEFEAALEQFVPDLIFSDFTFPGDFDGLAALEIARRKLPDVPFMFVSGTLGEERAVEAIRRGAADYVLKDRMARLGPAVAQVLERSRLRREKDQAETALLASEERLRLFVEHAPAAIAMMDRKMNYLAVSRRWLADYRVDEPNIVGRNHYDMFPEIAGQWKPIHQRCLAGAVEQREEDVFPQADGSTDWVRWEIHPWRRSDGEISGIIHFSELITERKLQRQRIERLSRIHALLSGIHSAIVRSGNRQQLLDESCRIAVERGGFGMVWIGMHNREKQEIQAAAQRGFPSEFGEIKVSIDSDDTSQWNPAARVIAGSEPFFDNNIFSQPQLNPMRQVAVALGYRSLAILPLTIEAVSIGALFLYAEEPGFFNDEEVKLLTELSGNVSFALESMARRDRVDRLLRIRNVTSEINAAIVHARHPQALFEEACRIAIEHGRFSIAWIGQFDALKLEVTPVASGGLESDSFLTRSKLVIRRDTPQHHSLIADAIRERRASYNNDIVADAAVGGQRRQEAIRRGCRSAIALPLIVEGAVVSTFSLFVNEANFFDDEEVTLLTELAGNISFALDNIARQEKLDKLSRIRAVSSGVNAAIARIRERGALFGEISRIATEQGKLEMVWIGMLDHEKRTVVPVAWSGFSAETANAVSWASIESTQGTLGEAVRTRKASVRDDIETQLPAGKLRQEAVEKGCHSTVCLPLVVEDQVVALISLFASGRGFFIQDELALLDEIAPNISFALESIARQQKIERLSRIRLVLGEINGAIVRTRDRQALFDEACRIAVEAGRLTFAWIGLLERDPMQIRPAAWAGVADPLLSDRQTRRPIDETGPAGPGPFAEAVLHRRPAIVNDVRSDPRITRKQDHLDRNIRSIAVLPLVLGDDVIGVLGLHAGEAGFFDEEEVKLLSELAGDIAFALQNFDKQEKLDYLSYYDALTGLPNRTLFVDRAGQQMRSRGGEPRMVALILLNLERFRNINETFGRKGGDELLKLVAQRLENAFLGKDYLARISADGFGVVVRGIRETTDMLHVIEDQLLGCFREPYLLDGNELRVAARAGLAMHPADGGDADTLFSNAEAALKKARGSGERYLFYAADMNARAAHVLSLETRLRKAVETEQFVLHYQPKIELATDRICGLEALIRWQEPGGELVPPGSFIPLLEETGLILEVGKWALGKALDGYAEWTERGCKAPRIAVNVSAIQLQQKDFSDMVINVVQEKKGKPNALELEVTESLLVKDVEASIRKLSFLRGLGIHIAMDDFGTGYSSLSYIARLPINLVKIDRSFINGMASSPQDMAIVTTIIALAHSLNLRVVAEGVETESQSKLLKLLKCDEAQGFLFSKPLPAVGIEPLLRALG